jgi:hypothetical protein
MKWPRYQTFAAQDLTDFAMIQLNHGSEIDAVVGGIHRLRRNLVGQCDLLNISKNLLLKKKERHPRFFTNEDLSRLAGIRRGISVRFAQLSLQQEYRLSMMPLNL